MARTPYKWRVAKLKLQYFGHITRGSAGQLALSVLEGIMEGLRHQGRPRRQWIRNIEEWTGCEYIQLKEMSQDEYNAEERYRSGRLLSQTLIEEGRLVSEWVTIIRCSNLAKFSLTWSVLPPLRQLSCLFVIVMRILVLLGPKCEAWSKYYTTYVLWKFHDSSKFYFVVFLLSKLQSYIHITQATKNNTLPDIAGAR